MGLITAMAYSRRLNQDVEAFMVRCDLTGRESSAVLCSFAGGIGYEKKRAMAMAKAVSNARAQGFVTSYQVSPSSLHAAKLSGVTVTSGNSAPALWFYRGFQHSYSRPNKLVRVGTIRQHFHG